MDGRDLYCPISIGPRILDRNIAGRVAWTVQGKKANALADDRYGAHICGAQRQWGGKHEAVARGRSESGRSRRRLAEATVPHTRRQHRAQRQNIDHVAALSLPAR